MKEKAKSILDKMDGEALVDVLAAIFEEDQMRVMILEAMTEHEYEDFILNFDTSIKSKSYDQSSGDSKADH